MSLLSWLFPTTPAPKSSPSLKHDDDMDRAALRVVADKLPWITVNHAASGYCSEAAIDAAETKAAVFRKWMLENTTGAWQAALCKWLEHSECSYRKARDELRTGVLRKERAIEKAGFEAEKIRARALAARMPTPPPM
jgi:hypothetical protein